MPGSPDPHGRAMLVALTPEASAALGAHERVITSFPYRVGGSRATRSTLRRVSSPSAAIPDPGPPTISTSATGTRTSK